MNAQQFFKEAFSRNIGLVSEAEAEKLRNSTVGIAGLGGVGGSYALTLARMGVGAMVISDFDCFELGNFNRQAGANMTSLDKPKLETMKEMLLQINPYLKITSYPEGVNESNVREFVAHCDIVVDSIDFFALKAHRVLQRECAKQGKVSLLSVPAGHSGTLQVFHPSVMSFDFYFDFKESDDEFEQLAKFVVGYAPWSLHARYIDFDPRTLLKGRPSSIASACAISTGLVTANVVLCLLGRFNSKHYAPFSVQADTYLLTAARGRVWGGNRNPIQRLKLFFVRNKYRSLRQAFNEFLRQGENSMNQRSLPKNRSAA